VLELNRAAKKVFGKDLQKYGGGSLEDEKGALK